MLVVEVIKLNRFFYLFMALDATIMMPNGSMDWDKYPKSRKSIRIQQPEILDIITCHTFPGLGGKPLDIALFNSSIFVCTKCFNCDAGPHKQFYCDTCPACACTSPPV